MTLLGILEVDWKDLVQEKRPSRWYGLSDSHGQELPCLAGRASRSGRAASVAEGTTGFIINCNFTLPLTASVNRPRRLQRPLALFEHKV